MMIMLHLLNIDLLFVCLVLLTSAVEKCGDNPTASENCEERATVVDMSGLDGCGYLLEVEDGRKMLPSNLEEFNIILVDKMVVQVSYKQLLNQSSICMAEDGVVELSCLQLTNSSSKTAECPRLIDPFDEEWSTSAMREIEPFQIDEHVTTQSRLYHFIGKEECRLYDCHGALLCVHAPGERDACSAYLAASLEQQTIYVEDN